MKIILFVCFFNLCAGFILTYENQVVHSTLTSDINQILCQFVQQHDFLCLRRKLQRLGRVIESDTGREYFTRKRFSFIGGNNNNNNSKKNLEVQNIQFSSLITVQLLVSYRI